MDCAWLIAVGGLYLGIRGIDFSHELKQKIEKALDDSSTVFLAVSYLKTDKETLINLSGYFGLAGLASFFFLLISNLANAPVELRVSFVALLVTSFILSFSILWHINYRKYAVDLLYKILLYSCTPALILLFDLLFGTQQMVDIVAGIQQSFDDFDIGLTLNLVSGTLVSILIFATFNVVFWVISHFFWGLILLMIITFIVVLSYVGTFCIRWSKRWPLDILMGLTLIIPFFC